MIGLDPIAGPTRYTFGFLDLFEGIDFTIVAVGLRPLRDVRQPFSRDHRQARELQLQVAASKPARPGHVQMGARLELLDGFFRRRCPGSRGNRLHHARLRDGEEVFAEPERVWLGIDPRRGRTRSREQQRLLCCDDPAFALGIPASGTTAVLLGGLLMVGLQPGPLLFTTNPEFVWTVFGSFWIGNIMLVFLTTILIPVLASIVASRRRFSTRS